LCFKETPRYNYNLSLAIGDEKTSETHWTSFFVFENTPIEICEKNIEQIYNTIYRFIVSFENIVEQSKLVLT